MKIKGTTDQSLFDIALVAFQDPSRVYELVTSGFVENINSEVAGVEFEFTQTKLTQKEVVKTIQQKRKVVTISEDQTVFDIALQYYGGPEFVFDFITENGLENIGAEPVGKTLKYTELKTIIPTYFRKKGKSVATNSSPEQLVDNSGIDFAIIESTLTIY
jgi:predicted Zn-dependent protease